MVAHPGSKLVARVVACVLACAFLLRVTPARADGIGENAQGPWPTEKKVVVWTMLGGSVVAQVYFWYAFAKSLDTGATLRNDFPREKDDPHSADCRSVDECNALRTTLDDDKAWDTRLAVAGFTSGALLIASVVTAALWPNRSTRIAPTAAQNGAGFLLETRF